MYEGEPGAPDWYCLYEDAIGLAQSRGITFGLAFLEVNAAPRNYAIHREVPWWTWSFLPRRIRLNNLRSRLREVPYHDRDDADPRVIEANALIARWEFCGATLDASMQMELRKRAALQKMSLDQIRRAFRSRHLKVGGNQLAFHRLSDEKELMLKVGGISLVGFVFWCYLLVASVAFKTGCIGCVDLLMIQIGNLAAPFALMTYFEGQQRRVTEQLLTRLGIRQV